MERRRQRWGGRGKPPYRCNFHETPLSLSYKFEKEKEGEEGLEKEEREKAPPAMILAPPPPVGGSVCISRGGVREPVVRFASRRFFTRAGRDRRKEGPSVTSWAHKKKTVSCWPYVSATGANSPRWRVRRPSLPAFGQHVQPSPTCCM